MPSVTVDVTSPFVNNRDELVTFESSLVALVKANGNYCSVYYINKREILLTVSISDIEQKLKKNNNEMDLFVKVGRSFIINQRYVHRIDLQRQLLILSNGETADKDFVIKISKGLLKQYKNAIVKSIKIINERKQNKKQ